MRNTERICNCQRTRPPLTTFWTIPLVAILKADSVPIRGLKRHYQVFELVLST